MDITTLKLLIEAGATGALIIVLVYIVRIMMPARDAQCLAALEQKRKDDHAFLEQARADFLRAQGETRSDLLGTLAAQRGDFLANLAQERQDFLAREVVAQAQFLHELDCSRLACERHMTLERDVHVEQNKALMNSLRSLGDLMVHQDIETRRARPFGVGPRPEEKP